VLWGPRWCGVGGCFGAGGLIILGFGVVLVCFRSDEKKGVVEREKVFCLGFVWVLVLFLFCICFFYDLISLCCCVGVVFVLFLF
jgi:hypothetical protein